jgi:hypothetical protein
MLFSIDTSLSYHRNIYGVSLLISRLPTYLDRAPDFPSSRHDQLPDTILPIEQKGMLHF